MTAKLTPLMLNDLSMMSTNGKSRQYAGFIPICSLGSESSGGAVEGMAAMLIVFRQRYCLVDLSVSLLVLGRWRANWDRSRSGLCIYM